MSLTLPQLLACLARCQTEEVAPALAEDLAADARNYAAGSAGTVAMLLQLAAAEAAGRSVRDAAAAAAVAEELGPGLTDRDARHAAFAAALAGGDRVRRRRLLALLAAEAAADCAALGLPLPAGGG